MYFITSSASGNPIDTAKLVSDDCEEMDETFDIIHNMNTFPYLALVDDQGNYLREYGRRAN